MTKKKKRFHLNLKVQKTGHTYLPDELRDTGFTGDIEVMPNYFTALLVKPGSTVEQVLESLKTHEQHLKTMLMDPDVDKMALSNRRN